MDKEKPHLAIWIAIAVLFINQLIMSHQQYQLAENQIEIVENQNLHARNGFELLNFLLGKENQ